MKKTLPICGLLALILLSALAIACGDSVSDDDAGAPANAAGGDLTAEGAPENESNVPFSINSTADKSVGGVDGSVSSDPNALPSLLDRQIIRTATVELTVGDVAGTMQLIENAATTAGGFVSGSSLSVEAGSQDKDNPRQRGTITVRVPADRYASVMNNIRGLVDDPNDINSLTEDTTEVTEEYTDLQSRLRNLEATESQYLDLLASAETIDDILTVQDRLNTTRSEIEQVKGRLQVLDDLTALATITVQLSLPPVTPPVDGGSQNWASEALDNAWQASAETLKVLGIIGITAGVFAAWLLVPGVIALGAWWAINSRRTHSEAS